MGNQLCNVPQPCDAGDRRVKKLDLGIQDNSFVEEFFLLMCEDPSPCQGHSRLLVAGQQPISLQVEGPELQGALELTLPGGATVLAAKRAVTERTGLQLRRQDLFLLDSADPLHHGRPLRDCLEVTEEGGSPRVQLSLELRRGPFAVSGGLEGGLKVWDFRLQRRFQEVRLAAPVSDLAVDWSADKLLAAAGQLKLWDMSSGRSVTAAGGWTDLPARCVALDWPSRRCLSGHDGGWLQLWSVAAEGLTILSGVRAQARDVQCLVADWSSCRCLCAGRGGELALVDAAAGEVLQRWPGHSSWVQCLAADWASGRALSGGVQGELRLWRLPEGGQLADMTTRGAVQCLDVSWPLARAFTGGLSGTVQLWDLDAGAALKDLDCPAAVNGISAFWEALRVVACCADGYFRVFDFAGQEVCGLWQAHARSAQCLAVDWAGASLSELAELLTLRDVPAEEVVEADDPPCQSSRSPLLAGGSLDLTSLRSIAAMA